MAAIVQILKAIDAATRIPWRIKGVTFFSDLDQWMYQTRYGDPCPACLEYESGAIYPGSSLRSLFPYLEILDEDMIAVNVHPNCNCFLERVYDVNE